MLGLQVIMKVVFLAKKRGYMLPEMRTLICKISEWSLVLDTIAIVSHDLPGSSELSAVTVCISVQFLSAEQCVRVWKLESGYISVRV